VTSSDEATRTKTKKAATPWTWLLSNLGAKLQYCSGVGYLFADNGSGDCLIQKLSGKEATSKSQSMTETDLNAFDPANYDTLLGCPEGCTNIPSRIIVRMFWKEKFPRCQAYLNHEEAVLVFTDKSGKIKAGILLRPHDNPAKELETRRRQADRARSADYNACQQELGR